MRAAAAAFRQCVRGPLWAASTRSEDVFLGLFCNMRAEFLLSSPLFRQKVEFVWAGSIWLSEIFRKPSQKLTGLLMVHHVTAVFENL